MAFRIFVPFLVAVFTISSVVAGTPDLRVRTEQGRDADIALEELGHVDFGIDDGLSSASRALSILENIPSALPPTSVKEVISRLEQINRLYNPRGYVEMSAELISFGLVKNSLKSILRGYKAFNKDDNVNTRNPRTRIFPKKSAQDAPYTQNETAMRSQIYIPKSFTFGKKPPVILVPGTGERGGNSFAGNFIKTLSNQDYADIVWINPPGYQLADAQVNAETVAYTVNYISGISRGKNVTLIGWSQGSLSMQWAQKYWPSIRKITSGVVALSGDYDGTILANVIQPLNAVPLPPSILQQKYNSNFVQALRSDDGDSAYVPTTTIYSSFLDAIVEPQTGRLASSFIEDRRKIGVSNYDIQKTCPSGSLAGAFVSHESNLYNPLTHALVVDGLKHGFPARSSRIDLKSVCSQFIAPGLSLDDALNTETTIPFAAAQIVLYPDKVFKEPPIKAYAM